MKKELDKYLEGFVCNHAATIETVESIEDELNFTLPKDYRDFIQEINGCEGSIGEHSYIALWAIEEIIGLNEAYEVKEFAPGILLIGSDGGETAYGFDMRSDDKPVVRIPFIGMDLNNVEFCANTFNAFLGYLYEV